MEKRAARKEVSRRIAALSAEDRRRRSGLVVGAVLGLPEFAKAGGMMLFVSMPDEVDVTGLIEGALRLGKRVCVPTCPPQGRQLVPAALTALGELVPRAYGILEPRTVRPVPVGEIDFVLVPGAAFDTKGNRLGRGAGYYDRFMSLPEFHAVKCGVAFDVQVLPEIPHDSHDLPVDILVTDERLLRFPGA